MLERLERSNIRLVIINVSVVYLMMRLVVLFQIDRNSLVLK